MLHPSCSHESQVGAECSQCSHYAAQQSLLLIRTAVPFSTSKIFGKSTIVTTSPDADKERAIVVLTSGFLRVAMQGFLRSRNAEG